MKLLNRLLAVASAAFFIAGSAFAQTSGTVTNHAFIIGKGAGTGYTSLLCGSAQLAVGQSAADPICKTITGDVTITAAGATAIGATKVTSAMLNADVFSTAHSWAGQQTFVAPILGTPASGTATNLTGLPISTGVSGLGTGVATFLATPSSANLRAALTDEVGTGAAYFVGGALGTPASGTATNLTGLPLSGLTAQAAYTFVGNNSGSSAIPTAVDIATLTTKASPAAGDYVMLSDQAASGAWKKATVSSVASAGSVSSIAGNTGAFTLGTGLSNSVNNIINTGVVTVKKQIFTASGTYTPSTGMIYCIIEGVGAGGGGGSAAASGASAIASAGGGGGGSYARLLATAATIGASKSVTIGAAGTGGTAGANGGNGGTTIVGSTLLSAGGGLGGLGGPATAGSTAIQGGAGGTATVGDLLLPGSAGGNSFAQPSVVTIGGIGGASAGIGSGGSASSANAAGITASGNGGGGGGGSGGTAGVTRAGGDGAPGVVIVTEFNSQ